METGGFDGAVGFLCPTLSCELLAHNFPIMAINHSGKMGPAILPTRNRRHIHRPSCITPAGSDDPALYARSRST
jgi:hypothetical protein